MKIIQHALFSLFVVGTCYAQQLPLATKDHLIYKGCVDSACALEISFASIGSGIDGTCYVKIEHYLQKKQLKYTAKSIGREGETRLCILQMPQSKKHKHQIIKDLRKILSQGQWVSMNVP